MAVPIGSPTAAEWFGPSASRPTDESARARANRIAEFFAGARRGRASVHHCTPECYPEWMRSSLPKPADAPHDSDTRGGAA